MVRCPGLDSITVTARISSPGRGGGYCVDILKPHASVGLTPACVQSHTCHVSCFMFHVSCFMFHVSCFMFHSIHVYAALSYRCRDTLCYIARRQHFDLFKLKDTIQAYLQQRSGNDTVQMQRAAWNFLTSCFAFEAEVRCAFSPWILLC
jgi:hypothetical protein